MSDAPEVSVVMGVHDAAPHLKATLDSILSQEEVDLEFVIIDDGSTDGSTEILREYAALDPRIRLVEQENRGLTTALIRGCELARGPLIARQDAADLSRPGRLSRQCGMLQKDLDLAFVGCWTEFRGPAMEYLYTVKDSGKARDPVDLVAFEDGRPVLVDAPTCHGAVMFRKRAYERVGGYREEFVLGQDRDLWPRLAEVGRYQALPEALYVARVQPTGTTLSHRSLQGAFGTLARQAFEYRQLHGSDGEILERARRLWSARDREGGSEIQAKGLYFIGEMLRRNGDRRCVRYFREALEADPSRWETWVRLLQALPLLVRNHTATPNDASDLGAP